jgi:tight adherence protein C
MELTGWMSTADAALAISIFGIVVFGIWGLVSLLADLQAKPLERMTRFLQPRTATASSSSNDWLRKRLDELMQKAGPTLTATLMPKTQEEQSDLRRRLSAAGFRSERAPLLFMLVRSTLGVLGALLGLVLMPVLPVVSKLPMWTGPILMAGLMFFLPSFVVARKARRRRDAIFHGLPDALDLLCICVEAGLTLDAALKRVAREIRRSCPVLAHEFELSTLQLQMGRSRHEVLRDLGQRNDVDDLRALAATLIQADRFGTSIGQALRVHSDSMRTRRRQLAEERAQKTTVKLIVPLVLFIFPGIFVVLVGPAAIMIIRNLLYR